MAATSSCHRLFWVHTSGETTDLGKGYFEAPLLSARKPCSWVEDTVKTSGQTRWRSRAQADAPMIIMQESHALTLVTFGTHHKYIERYQWRCMNLATRESESLVLITFLICIIVPLSFQCFYNATSTEELISKIDMKNSTPLPTWGAERAKGNVYFESLAWV